MNQSLLFQTIAKYSEPWRRFHTMEHLAALWAAYERACTEQQGYLCYREAMEYLIPFHDWVYVPGSQTNEIESAEFAIYWLEKVERRDMSAPADPPTSWSAMFEPSRFAAQFSQQFIRQVPRIILGTQHHRDPLTDFEALFFDMDLSGLGSDPEGYKHTSKQVRDEFLTHVKPDEFREGRAKWLRSMLARPVLFHMPEFRKFETPARQNMENELSGFLP